MNIGRYATWLGTVPSPTVLDAVILVLALVGLLSLIVKAIRLTTRRPIEVHTWTAGVFGSRLVGGSGYYFRTHEKRMVWVCRDLIIKGKGELCEGQAYEVTHRGDRVLSAILAARNVIEESAGSKG